MLERIASAVQSSGRCHLVVGGSFATAFQTEVSDLDLFLVAHSETGPLLSGAIGRLMRRQIDLEEMSYSKFQRIVSELDSFAPSATIAMSPFSFGDLRFLARSVNGTPLIADPDIRDTMESRRDKIRTAAAAYVSTMYVMKYQDLFGFHASGRMADFAVCAGEVYQFACLLSLLQLHLPDLSLKSAPSALGASADESVRALAAVLADCFTGQHAPPSKSPELFLRLLNSLVGAAILSRDGVDDCVCTSEQPTWAPEYCVVGTPGFLTVVNVRNNRVGLCNHAYLKQIASDVR